MTAPYSLGQEYRDERILELECLRDELVLMPHSPACPGNEGCWCPLHDVLDLVDDRVADLQSDLR